MRCISTYKPTNESFYITQTVLILAGPPIYSAAEYNILGRLMHYLPMHAPLNPNRVVIFFVYLGAAVEALTGNGASRLSSAKGDQSKIRSGGTLIASAVVLQAAIEALLMAMVGLLHYRCARSNMLTHNVRNIFLMLYGTSTLVLLRCIFRAVENFSVLDVLTSNACNETCRNILRHEWYLYAFEAAPMVIYTYWLNIMHPGRLLPHRTKTFLDLNNIERLGPGWIDRRSKLMTFVDPFDIRGIIRGHPAHEKFWLCPDDWPVAVDGSGMEEVVINDTKGAKQANPNNLISP